MDTTTDSANLEAVARQIRLPLERVRSTVELLDEGNTVPFITRYRKDRTGGLDEEQIRRIQEAVSLQRQLVDRKEKVLRSIESQSNLTEELEQKISAATSLKTLEDLYLPYRPKKQTLATVARQRGLEPLAREVLNAVGEVEDLEARSAAYVDPDKELATVSDVLVGVGHILAETFSERADLRALTRKTMWAGTLVSKLIEIAPESAGAEADSEATDTAPQSGSHELKAADAASQTAPHDAAGAEGPAVAAEDGRSGSCENPPPAEASPPAESPTTSEPETPDGEPSANVGLESAAREDDVATAKAPESPADVQPSVGEDLAGDQTEDGSVQDRSTVTAHGEGQGASDGKADPSVSTSSPKVATPTDVRASKLARAKAAEDRRVQRREARRRKRQKLEQSFKDYFSYSEPISRLPHYRVLAINRGERCKVLRVKIQFDNDRLRSEAEKLVIPADHPYNTQLRDSLHDALNRLVVPSIEREIRRELTDRAELHAVSVFAQNLRKLLLQPPLHHHRVLAIDPGFRSGCKLVALDEFGNVLSHTLIHVIGAAERVQLSRKRLIEQIREHKITVVAIGNGTASRETEQLVAQVMTDELSDVETKYLMVNEAGASVYSTSQTGREELPKCDATVRGAVSIGRRALDPLSELVKIDPANIGVGLYQHDIKAKHLRTSLDAVVESCVNYVGVDINSASPALLGYVSGLNQLTARRLYEFRLEHGPFRDREQLKQVPGIGEATFVQAAGFLKIPGAGNPLDETWIHPESYEIARRVLDEIGCDVAELTCRATAPSPTMSEAPPAEGEATAAEPNPNPDVAAETPTDVPADVATESPQAEAAEQDTADESVAPTEQPEQAESAVTAAPEPLLPAPLSPEAAGEQVSAVAAAPVQPPASSESPPTPAEAVGETAAAPDHPTGDTAPAAEKPSSLAERLMQIDVSQLAEKLSVGKLLLADILASLARPGRDPREDLSPPALRREILKLEDLKPGMKFSGAVLNVVDFGAFVDIGLTDSGLIHVSRLADRFIADPHDVVSVGDILDVWVVDVDEKRRRVSLTAIEPGSEKPRPARPKKTTSEPKTPQKRRKPARPKSSEKRQDTGARGKGSRPASRRPKKPKPVVPITDAMAEGREPMRTFSDLLQFHKRKKEPDDPETPSDINESST